MPDNNKLNFIAAITLSLFIILAWQFFYEKPRVEKLGHQQSYNQYSSNKNQLTEDAIFLDRAAAIKSKPRIEISTPKLQGSIALQGLRIDDLSLRGYKKDISDQSPNIELFSPSNTPESYFAEVGWYSSQKNIDLPNATSLWKANKTLLQIGDIVTFSWTNKAKVKFCVDISVDEDYMFTIKQYVINDTNQALVLQSYGLIHKNFIQQEKSINILHQGAIATINGKLQELTYENLKDKKNVSFTRDVTNWLGITDKYWLAAFVPDQKGLYNTNFTYASAFNGQKYQVDFLGEQEMIAAKSRSTETTTRLFAGAKKVDLLDKYEKIYNIKLFDRAIDFGWLYIITKPLFHLLNFFYRFCGNFGVSILIVTVLIKIAMFTLANQSYRSMEKMKKIQPESDKLKALYGDDKVQFNQKLLELYKQEKVNPVMGCLPLLIQIPVFFSLYKVLYVTIEMRHAPFFGWIKDLSAPDPTSVFNLFGLLHYPLPGFLHIGLWPIFMATTMVLQQRMSPQPADPVQAQVMRFMPLIFLIMFSSFPAGLLIYWTWNNILSIIQQSIISKFDSKNVEYKKSKK